MNNKSEGVGISPVIGWALLVILIFCVGYMGLQAPDELEGGMIEYEGKLYCPVGQQCVESPTADAGEIEVFEDGSFIFNGQMYCVPSQPCDGEVLDIGEYWGELWAGDMVNGDPNGATAILHQGGQYSWLHGPGYGPNIMLSCLVGAEVAPLQHVLECNGDVLTGLFGSPVNPGSQVLLMGTIADGSINVIAWQYSN